jgi:hypothetical protein
MEIAARTWAGPRSRGCAERNRPETLALTASFAYIESEGHLRPAGPPRFCRARRWPVARSARARRRRSRARAPAGLLLVQCVAGVALGDAQREPGGQALAAAGHRAAPGQEPHGGAAGAQPTRLLVERDPADRLAARLEPQLDLVEPLPAERVRPGQLPTRRPAGMGGQRARAQPEGPDRGRGAELDPSVLVGGGGLPHVEVAPGRERAEAVDQQPVGVA